MMLRGFSDGSHIRAQQASQPAAARLSASGAFQPDFLGARHDHDFVHGNAARGSP
jgi:hypothetical protein